MGAVVAFLAEKNESVGPHGLDVVDDQVFLRTASQAGCLGDLARSDQMTRHPSNLHTLPLSRVVPTAAAVACAFAFAQYECIGTISGNHVGTSLGCRLARAGRVVRHLLGSPCAQGGVTV